MARNRNHIDTARQIITCGDKVAAAYGEPGHFVWEAAKAGARLNALYFGLFSPFTYINV